MIYFTINGERFPAPPDATLGLRDFINKETVAKIRKGELIIKDTEGKTYTPDALITDLDGKNLIITEPNDDERKVCFTKTFYIVHFQLSIASKYERILNGKLNQDTIVYGPNINHLEEYNKFYPRHIDAIVVNNKKTLIELLHETQIPPVPILFINNISEKDFHILVQNFPDKKDKLYIINPQVKPLWKEIRRVVEIIFGFFYLKNNEEKKTISILPNNKSENLIPLYKILTSDLKTQEKLLQEKLIIIDQDEKIYSPHFLSNYVEPHIILSIKKPNTYQQKIEWNIRTQKTLLMLAHHPLSQTQIICYRSLEKLGFNMKKSVDYDLNPEKASQRIKSNKLKLADLTIIDEQLHIQEILSDPSFDNTHILFLGISNIPDNPRLTFFDILKNQEPWKLRKIIENILSNK